MVESDKQRTSSAAPPGAPTAGASTGTHAGAGAESRGSSTEDLTNEAKSQINRTAEQAKAQGRQMFEEQKGNAVGHLDKIARALHETAGNMRDQNEQTAGNVVDQAASGLERLARSLRTQDLETMYSQARDTVRRQPALFIGGTVAAGFLLTRFLKSSSEHPHGSQTESGSTDETGSTSYVTSAHADAEDMQAGRATPPTMPTGRRNY